MTTSKKCNKCGVPLKKGQYGYVHIKNNRIYGEFASAILCYSCSQNLIKEYNLICKNEKR